MKDTKFWQQLKRPFASGQPELHDKETNWKKKIKTPLRPFTKQQTNYFLWILHVSQ
jgi:hypothetical protein